MTLRNKTLKITLENLLDVLLNHGISVQKIESIMADLGIPAHYIERALANIITIFPQNQKAEKISSKEKGGQVNHDVITQLREVRELMEKVYNKLFSVYENA
ncbi:MAG: hypothetical protein ACXQTU_04590 [Candidatus Nezhaarchaeales archaeon]